MGMKLYRTTNFTF